MSLVPWPITAIRHTLGLQQDRHWFAGKTFYWFGLSWKSRCKLQWQEVRQRLASCWWGFDVWEERWRHSWQLDQELGVKRGDLGTATGTGVKLEEQWWGQGQGWRARGQGSGWRTTLGHPFQGPVSRAPGSVQTTRQVSSWSHTPTGEELQSTSHWSCTNWSVISRVKMLTNFLPALVQSWDSASGQMAPVPPTVWLSNGGFNMCVLQT